MTSLMKSGWLVPILLLIYSGFPVLLGLFQLGTLGQGVVAGEAMNDDVVTYFDHPLPITAHIVTGILFTLLTPFQLVPSIRLKRPNWHRRTGKLLIVAGFVAALSGMWMNQFFPHYGGALKYTGVLAYGVGLIGSLSIALHAIRQRNIARHRAWMLRAIAIGFGIATQGVIIIPIYLINDGVSELTIGVVVWAGLLINLTVVEIALRREREIPKQLLLERSPS